MIVSYSFNIFRRKLSMIQYCNSDGSSSFICPFCKFSWLRLTPHM